MTHRRRAAAVSIALATLISLLGAVARRLDPIPDGLRAQYFPNTDWGGEPARSNPAGAPFTDQMLADVAGAAPHSFSAVWNGWIVTPASGMYTFATVSRDGSWVYIDGALVVDHGGDHGAHSTFGPTIERVRGVHPVLVKYAATTGRVELSLLWQRGNGPFEPVPRWAMRPRRISYARFVVDRTADIAGDLAVWVWFALLASAGLFGFRHDIRACKASLMALRSQLRIEGAWSALGWIVLGSTLVNVIGLWWGLPRGVWVGDELMPTFVVSAWEQHFSHGWHDKYPPLHYYLLSLVYAPLVGVGWVSGASPPVVETLLVASGRLVSVTMGAGTVIATFFSGRRAFGPRAGLLAAAAFALVTPFVYYAKAANVDVPYLMWFAISLFFYLKVLQGGTPSDYFWWAATATLAVCTKDQAYGLVVLMPLVVIYEQRRIDRRIGIAALTGVILFVLVHNIPFNASGFVGHIRTILGPASEGYRVYEPTLRGRAALAGVTLRLVERNWGWPMFVASIGGVIMALADASRRRLAVWLLVPIASYYVTFINVVLYNYDRFLLPVCLILSLPAGYALERFLRASSRWGWRRISVAGVFAYTMLYAITVDALMLTDSRYTAERWLARHAAHDDLIAMSSIATYMPRMEGLRATEVYDRESLDQLCPKFYVLNADYTLTEPADSPLGRTVAALRRGTGGYRLAFTARANSPWPWLPGAHIDLVGPRRDPEMVSFLRNISPTIEIFERVAPE